MYDQDLTDLEDAIRRLKVEYDIFFSGNRKKPPDDLRFRVDKMIRRLAEVNLTVQERFRYNALVSRICVYRDLWRRNQNERELGLDPREEAGCGRPPVAVGDREKHTDGITVSITDPEKEEKKIRRLYETLINLQNRNAKNSPAVTYPQFVRYITGQTHGIRGKFQCSSVLFTLRVEEDAIRFLAKAQDTL